MLKFQKRESQACRNSSLNFLNKMDFFALHPQFQVLKRTSFTTCVGHFLTICLATISIFYLYIQLENLTNQTQPNIIISENQPLNTPAIPLTKSNFTFVISITNAVLQSFDKNLKYYNLTVNQCLRKRSYDDQSSSTNVTVNCTTYPLEPCELGKHLVTDYQKSYFKNFKLSTMYCVNPDFWDQRYMNFQGHSQSDNFQYILVQLDTCKNSTHYQNCSPTAEISKALFSGYFVLYLSDSLIKMGNPGRPYEDIITIQNTPFSFSQSIQQFSMFKIASTNTDVGLINNQIQQENTIVQSQFQQYSASYNNYYLVLNAIYLDQRENLYTRSYIKLQTILGNVGGFWQIISLLLSAFLSPILQTYMNLSLVSKFFKIEGQDNPMHESLQNDIPIFSGFKDQLPIIDKILSDQQSGTDQKIQAGQLKQLKEYLKRKKNPNKFTFQDALLMYFGCKGQQQRTLRFAIQKIVTKLDIAFILRKLHEIDKLKSILLTNDQLKLFNYVPKPLIPKEMFNIGFSSRTMQKSIRNDSLEILEDEKSEIQKLEDSYSAYTRIIQKMEQSELDRVMINQLDEEIKGIFEYLVKKQNSNAGLKPSRLDSVPVSPRDEEFLISQEPKAEKVQRN